ncbi:class I SAM-dependent methyltransferase [Leifsonia sp. NPDC058230]|uniref:class I SAM-dependent methyltransferase n=1 Tax=Leifsonia sp. NPDC058230 TaxID=3346391 RepID=UPI0036D8ED11
MADDRRDLRTRFDSTADLYQVARPDYPEQLYDTLVDVTGLERGASVLEVGCATGKATIPLARRGMQLTCVEIGVNLAAAARRNLVAYPNVRVVTGAFETARVGADRFDLVFAATAWHWIDPGIRYGRAWELLNDDGHLAFWSATHVFPEGGDPFFAELQEIYEEIGEGKGDEAKPRPGELPDSREEIAQSGLFEVAAIVPFDWEVSYTAEEYLHLLDTFSNHIAMDRWKRDRLDGEIRRRLDLRADGRLRRHWGAVLHIARRRGRD